MNWNRRMRILVPAVALVLFPLATALSLAAQVPSTAMPTVESTRSPVGDTTALAKEAEGWLADLIRIDTTNPPGNEQAAAKYIAAVLTKEGINSEFLDLAPGRSALVARIRSAAMPDPSRALLLVAHMDVVRPERLDGRIDQQTRIVPADDPGTLPYDHTEIIQRAVATVRASYELAPDPERLIPGPFTLLELRLLHEAVVGRNFQRDTFRRLMEPQLTGTGKMTSGTRGRPAELFRHKH